MNSASFFEAKADRRGFGRGGDQGGGWSKDVSETEQVIVISGTEFEG
jgi:hypothetical protein